MAGPGPGPVAERGVARARGEREPQDRPVRTSAARGEAVNQKHDVDVLPACAKDLKIRGRAGAVQPYHEVPGIPLPDLGRARNRGKPFCIPNRFQVSRRMILTLSWEVQIPRL